MLANYSGERTSMHISLIPQEYYDNAKDKAMNYYLDFVDKDANNEPFIVPEYKF